MVTCPAGYSCPSASMTAPAACLEGNYQSGTGQITCIQCPAGSYCSSIALTAVTGVCPAGYYCAAGSINPMGF